MGADVCHGVPVENWQKWFGKDGNPNVRLLPEPAQGEADQSAALDDAGESPGQLGADLSAEKLASPSDAADPATAPESHKTSEFLELHSNLNIVSADDGAARRSAAASSLSSSINQSKQIQLTLGGERIVETADGLFGADEVQVDDITLPTIEEPDQDGAARVWLESTGSNPGLPANWESILAAKGTAHELYTEHKIREACQATTAAIQALEKFAAFEPGVSDDLADGTLDTDRSAAEQAGQRPSEAEIEGMRGVLHSNRSLLLQHQILAGESDVLAFGADAGWRLVVNDSDVALRANPTNFKASFRRARALLELGELDEALQDATNVVDYYASTSSTPNPEAAALRERILEAIKKERGKWGEKGPRRWNRSAKDLITEISSSTSKAADAAAGRERKPSATSMPWDSNAKAGASTLPQRLPDPSSKPLPAPRTSSDVEKMLLTTLKEPAGQLSYVREHLPVATLRRFYKRTPLGPDLLARLIRVSADLAQEDAERAEDLVCALAAVPSAKTDTAMFDAEEKDVLQRLTARLGPKATEAWAD